MDPYDSPFRSPMVVPITHSPIHYKPERRWKELFLTAGCREDGFWGPEGAAEPSTTLRILNPGFRA